MARLESRPPSIACIGVIGRETVKTQSSCTKAVALSMSAQGAAQDQPLHISLFPPYSTQPAGAEGTASAAGPEPSSSVSTAYIDFSFILHSSLDVFTLRSRDRTRVDQDLGLLHAIDERLSVWGWETPTGTKFIIVLDAWGRPDKSGDADALASGGGGFAWGMRDGDLKSAFKALQTAYIRLLQNPFYRPDEHSPAGIGLGPSRDGMIKSKRFAAEVNRIGMAWGPGMSTV